MLRIKTGPAQKRNRQGDLSVGYDKVFSAAANVNPRHKWKSLAASQHCRHCNSLCLGSASRL